MSNSTFYYESISGFPCPLGVWSIKIKSKCVRVVTWQAWWRWRDVHRWRIGDLLTPHLIAADARRLLPPFAVRQAFILAFILVDMDAQVYQRTITKNQRTNAQWLAKCPAHQTRLKTNVVAVGCQPTKTRLENKKILPPGPSGWQRNGFIHLVIVTIITSIQH